MSKLVDYSHGMHTSRILLNCYITLKIQASQWSGDVGHRGHRAFCICLQLWVGKLRFTNRSAFPVFDVWNTWDDFLHSLTCSIPGYSWLPPDIHSFSRNYEELSEMITWRKFTMLSLLLYKWVSNSWESPRAHGCLKIENSLGFDLPLTCKKIRSN